MRTPNLTIGVEPLESGKIIYLSAAPRTTGRPRNGQLWLKLSIKNNESTQVHVSQLRVSFIGRPAVSAVTIPLALDIAAGKSASWFFSKADSIMLPVPAPGTIELALSCTGFAAPATLSLPLVAHHSPTPAGSDRAPARAREALMQKGEGDLFGAATGHEESDGHRFAAFGSK